MTHLRPNSSVAQRRVAQVSGLSPMGKVLAIHRMLRRHRGKLTD